jgi:hypothetical protein
VDLRRGARWRVRRPAVRDVLPVPQRQRQSDHPDRQLLSRGRLRHPPDLHAPRQLADDALRRRRPAHGRPPGAPAVSAGTSRPVRRTPAPSARRPSPRRPRPHRRRRRRPPARTWSATTCGAPPPAPSTAAASTGSATWSPTITPASSGRCRPSPRGSSSSS